MSIQTTSPLPVPPKEMTQDYARRLNMAIDQIYRALANEINNYDGLPYNIDGGGADSTYTAEQVIDAGTV